jgi:hypothetical protein
MRCTSPCAKSTVLHALAGTSCRRQWRTCCHLVTPRRRWGRERRETDHRS